MEKIKLEFLPGCFDNFEGTQEELDLLIQEIQNLVSSGQIFEQGEIVDIDELFDQDPETALKLTNHSFDRKLQ